MMRQQAAQQQQALQYQQMYMQQQQIAQQQQMSASAKKSTSPSRFPAVPSDVIAGSRVSHTASPQKSRPTGSAPTDSGPQRSSMSEGMDPSSTKSAGGTPAGYLSVDEYKQHFTPEQLAVLAKRNQMNNNFVEK